MFRRQRAFQPNPLNPDQLADLLKANQLVARGKMLQAGAIFASLAYAMKTGNHPRRAANLYARAAHAYADGNDRQSAQAYSEAALSLFLQTQMYNRAATFYTRITGKMTAKGMNAAVAELKQKFGSRITDLPTKPLAMPPLRRSLLPTTCPQCGAPLHTEDLTWVDENTVECDFCGSLIRSEA